MTTRETFGQRILRARSGRWTRPQLSERLKTEFKKNVSISTIQDLEHDDAPNPGVKTVEAVCLGVNLDPLSTIALLLDDPPELDDDIDRQLAQVALLYPTLKKSEKPLIDFLLDVLIEQMKRRQK